MIRTKRFISLLFLIIPGLVACTATDDQPIVPGDHVGAFLVTTATADYFASSPFLDFEQYCQRAEDIVTCAAATGTTFNICYIFYSDTVADLDDRWSRAEYQVYIEDRPVDLEAFGYVDFVHPDFGWPMRSWNVVAKSTEPAALKIRHAGTVDGETFEDTMTLTLGPSPAD